MKINFKSHLIFFLVVSVAICPAYAETAPSKKESKDLHPTGQDLMHKIKSAITATKTSEENTKDSGLEPKTVISERDPFATSERMLEESSEGGEPQFIPGASGGIPKLSLRGFIRGEGEKPAALVEAENFGIYVVREGDTISLQKGGAHTVVKIRSIQEGNVHVEIGTLGQTIIIR